MSENLEGDIRKVLGENKGVCWINTIAHYDEDAKVYKLSQKGGLFIFERVLEYNEFEFATMTTSLDLLLEHIIGKYI